MKPSSFLRFVCSMATALVAMLLQAQAPFSLDTTFRTSFVSQNVNDMVFLPDGKLLLSGRMRFPGDQNDRNSVRLFPNGQQDMVFPTFPSTTGGGRFVPWQDRIYVQAGATVRRLTNEGLIDNSFSPMFTDPLFLSGQGGDFHVFQDGRVVISGTHVLRDSIRGFLGSHQFIWFTNTGQLDIDRIHRKGNGALNRFVELPDGKFIISGYASSYEGQPVDRVFRVHADGSLDSTFRSGVEWGSAFDFLPLPDGRTYASGYFRITGVADTLGLIRMLPDGSLDPTFNNQLDFGRGDISGFTGWPGTVGSVQQYDAGRLIITGAFRSVNEVERGGICLVDTNGAMLNSAFTGPGCGYYYHPNLIYASLSGIEQDGNGAYYIYGAYHGYDDGETNDPDQRFMSRLFGGELPPEPVGTGTVEQARIGSTFNVYPNPTRDNATIAYTFTTHTGQAHVRLLDLAGREVKVYTLRGSEGQLLLDTHAIASGVYLVELRVDERLVHVEKLVLE